MTTEHMKGDVRWWHFLPFGLVFLFLALLALVGCAPRAWPIKTQLRDQRGIVILKGADSDWSTRIPIGSGSIYLCFNDDIRVVGMDCEGQCAFNPDDPIIADAEIVPCH